MLINKFLRVLVGGLCCLGREIAQLAVSLFPVFMLSKANQKLAAVGMNKYIISVSVQPTNY